MKPKSTPAAKAVSAPSENKAVASPEESKAPAKKEPAPKLYAVCVKQPMMAAHGTVAPREVFECTQREFERYGSLVKKSSEKEFQRCRDAIKEGRFAQYADASAKGTLEPLS